MLRRAEYRDGTEHSETRLAAVEHLAEAHEIILTENRFFLPAVKSARLLECVRNVLLLYNCLTHKAIAKEQLIYNQTSKFHYIEHTAFHARFLNPRCVWGYMYENFMGLCARSAKACAHGTPLVKIGSKLMQNWRLVYLIRCRRRRHHIFS